MEKEGLMEVFDLMVQAFPIANWYPEEISEIRELVDKATPKKPVMAALLGFSADQASRLVCPTCKQPIVNVWSQREYRPRYCHYCGQALDWGADQ